MDEATMKYNRRHYLADRARLRRRVSAATGRPRPQRERVRGFHYSRSVASHG